MQFFAIFQAIVSFMSLAQKMTGATGEQKKALVMQGVKSALPLIVPMLPSQVGAAVTSVESILPGVSKIIDDTHAVLKANNLYPHLDEVLQQASSVVAVTNATLQSAFPQPQGD